MSRPTAEQHKRISNDDGFIAALDQSGGSTPKALAQYGIPDTAYSGDTEMFDLIHQMRSRIITAPEFTSDKIIGAILFERTMNGAIEGMPTADYLWQKRGVVPFLKVDKGLEAEADGVQLMKPMPGLAALLETARAKNIYGTKMRSVIQSANASGIAAIVAQQFDIGKEIIAQGLVPILEPEVNINAADKAECETILAAEISKQLDALADDQNVMLKLTIPSQAGLYDTIAQHPRVVRVVALSGGYTTSEACALLAKNSAMIASFSRALVEGLNADMTDAAFNAALGANIAKIAAASKAG